MAILTYNSGRIVPAPLVSINKQILGDKIGVTFSIVLTGTLVAHRGSPMSDGTFSATDVTETTLTTSDQKFRAIQRKQEALRDLFKTEGLVLQIQTGDAFTTLQCNPRNINIEFQGGEREVWVDKCQYTITCEADRVYGPGIGDGLEDEDLLTTSQFLQEANESWQIEFKEYHFSTITSLSAAALSPVYQVTHSIRARGKRSYDSGGSKTTGVDNARAWVATRLGFNVTKVTTNGSLTIPSTGYTEYNYQRSTDMDDLDGTYSVVESWEYTPTQSATPAVLSINLSYALNQKSTPFLTGGIKGTIRGLDNSGGLTKSITAFNNAFNFYRNNIETSFNASVYPNVSLYLIVLFASLYPFKNVRAYNYKQLSKTVEEDINQGIITFAYEIDSSPKSDCIVANAMSQAVVVSESLPGHVIAEIPIINRRLGPILQNMNTYTARKRTLSAEFVIEPSSTCVVADQLTYKPNIDGLVESIKPTGVNIQTHVYKVSDVDTWDFFNGRYSRNVEWIYQEDCGS